MQVKWKRNKIADSCELYVKDSDKWVHYKQAKFYKPDATLSTKSGFATFQVYLKRGATIINGIDET